LTRALIVCAVAVSALPAAAQTLTREQQAEFLRTARVISSAPIGKGVTRPYRLTLSDGKTTHDAAFQSVDERRAMSRTGRGGAAELNFRDSWRYNVAAPRLAEILGIGDMVPVTVERSWNSKDGALTWWVDDVLMDEQERREKNVAPPDKAAWNRLWDTMRVFTQLAYDTDRNQGNLLITKDWRLVMIDFTRAFRSWDMTPEPLQTLRRCDRDVLARMRELTKAGVQNAAGEYLSSFEVGALIARRDAIVKHFDALIAQLGEDQVVF